LPTPAPNHRKNIRFITGTTGTSLSVTLRAVGNLLPFENVHLKAAGSLYLKVIDPLDNLLLSPRDFCPLDRFDVALGGCNGSCSKHLLTREHQQAWARSWQRMISIWRLLIIADLDDGDCFRIAPFCF
jgi:hypothetical protein